MTLFNYAMQFIININKGDIIYYVSSKGGTYAIHKTRIEEKSIQRHNGFHAGIDIIIYCCEDGYTFDTTRLDLPVFSTMAQAIDYIVEHLNADIQLTKVTLRNAQERLTKLQRSLKVYQKYQIKDETE